MELAPLYLIVSLSWVICLWYAFGYSRLGRLSKRQTAEQDTSRAVPPVSIIIPVHNQSQYLKAHLPLLLSQEYAQYYEIIVVDEQSSDETIDLLGMMEDDFSHLSHITCPSSARDISLHRLALTLGVRQAQFQWVLFLQPGCYPADAHWLTAFIAGLTPECEAMLGLSTFQGACRWRRCQMQFHRLWHQMMWLPSQRCTAPYYGDPLCLCYQRSLFLEHQGFASSALLNGGAEALLLNHHVRPSGCTLSISREALLRQDTPSAHQWKQERLFFVETRHHMHHLLPTRLLYFSHLLASLLFFTSAILLSILCWPNWLISAAVGGMWLVLIIFRGLSLHLTTRALGLPSCIFSFPFLYPLVPCLDLASWLRWHHTDKRTFRRKFV